VSQDLVLGAALSAAIETAINRAIELDPVGAARRRQLDGRHVRIESTAPELTLCLSFGEARVRVEHDAKRSHPADAIVRGPLTALVRDFGRDDEAEVTIDGDVNLAHAAKRLFKELEPDFEEAIASLVGDRAANILGGVIREGAKLTRGAINALVGGDKDGAP
jgi:ubiquinone biosynthesis protein UbiJ